MLQAIIWLADSADFDEMNAVWAAWVPKGDAPARACGEARLARTGLKVEVTVTAAIERVAKKALAFAGLGQFSIRRTEER